MKLKQQSLTAEDGKLIESQLTAALVIVTGLRKYLEPAGKLKSAEIRQFKAAETALHAIRVKTTSGRAAEFMERVNKAQQGKFNRTYYGVRGY